MRVAFQGLGCVGLAVLIWLITGLLPNFNPFFRLVLWAIVCGIVGSALSAIFVKQQRDGISRMDNDA